MFLQFECNVCFSIVSIVHQEASSLNSGSVVLLIIFFLSVCLYSHGFFENLPNGSKKSKQKQTKVHEKKFKFYKWLSLKSFRTK